MDYPLPTVHLNGTGRDTLLTEYKEAHAALVAARDALVKTTCHGRDYYPQGPQAYYQAVEARNQFLSRLDEIQYYLERHLIHLSKAA